MRKSYFIILLIVFFACSKKKEGNISNELNKDIKDIDRFLENCEKPNYSDEEKITFNKRALGLILKNDFSKEKLSRLYIASENFYKYTDLENLRKSSFKLLEFSKEFRDTISIAKSYNLIGRYYFSTSMNDSAYYYYVTAEKLLNKQNDKSFLSKNYINKALVLFNENNYSASENSAIKALSYIKGNDDFKIKFTAYNLIGACSDELKNSENAIIYYNKALILTDEKKLVEYKLKPTTYNNLGLVYQNIGEHNQAIKHFKKALNQKDLKKENPNLYAKIIDNLAYSKFKSRDLTEIPKLFYDALKIREKYDGGSGIVINKIHLSEFFHYKGDSVKSVEYALEALKLAKSTKISGDVLASFRQLSVVDEKVSSKYSKEYIKLYDSIQVAERRSIDRFARIELETDELREQNTQLSEQNRDILNYFMLAIVFGGFLFFARFQRLKARELALKQTQQQANEEIYRLIISHQNQLEEGRDLEKKRISKELHDGVLGRLFGLRLNLDGLNNFDDEETKRLRLEYLNELKVIEQDLREISHELSRENLVLINNFVAIINNLLEQQTKINNAKVNTLISDKIDWEKVSNTIKINLYRILQEALQNINKHAEAKNINVIFNKDSKGNLIFSVEDDGKGYNTNGKKSKGIGVNNIVDRVHQCQGKIDIKSQIGKGTKIIITFPLENETINV